MKWIWLQKTTAKSSPLLEWQTCESESAWQSMLHAPALHEDADPTLGFRSGRTVHRWWAGVIFLAVLFVGASWFWDTGNIRQGQTEADLQNVVEGDLGRITYTQMEVDSQHLLTKDALAQKACRDARILQNRVQAKSRNPAAIIVKALSFTGGRAVIEFAVYARSGQPLLRQIHLYRHNALGWQQSKQVQEMWIFPHRQASSYFVFRRGCHSANYQ